MYRYNYQRGSLFQRIISMGQSLPTIDQSKSHINRKNSEVFRNFVLDKIYDIEENKAKKQSASKTESHDDLDLLSISKNKAEGPFTISGTRMKDKTNFAKAQTLGRPSFATEQSRIKRKQVTLSDDELLGIQSYEKCDDRMELYTQKRKPRNDMINPMISRVGKFDISNETYGKVRE